MKTKKIRITLTEGMLGSLSADPDIYRDFLASKAKKEQMTDEKLDVEIGDLPNLEDLIEKTMTVFPRDDDGEPFYYDYQVKGFIKAAVGTMCEFSKIIISKSPKVEISKWTFKRFVDNHIFVHPRKIKFNMPDGKGLDVETRPLRAETQRGPRVALSHSEQVPAGTTFDIEIEYDEHLESLIVPILDYGQNNGIGQWHNSGKGRFTWEELQ